MRVFDELVGARPLASCNAPKKQKQGSPDGRLLPAPAARAAMEAGRRDPLTSVCPFATSAGNAVVMPDEMLFSILLRAHGHRKPAAWGEVSALLGKMRNTFGITAGITTCALRWT